MIIEEFQISSATSNFPYIFISVLHWVQFSSVQSLSHVQLFVAPWIAARQASLSITISWSSLKLTSIESVMPSSCLILCHSLFLRPPIPPSIRVFSSESALCIRWPKYWSFSFSIIPFSSLSHRQLPDCKPPPQSILHWFLLLFSIIELKSFYHLPQSVIRHSIMFLCTVCPTWVPSESIWVCICFSSLSRVPSSEAATKGMLHKYLLNELSSTP